MVEEALPGTDPAPTHAEANFLMAQILSQQGNADEAVNHLRATLRGNPSHLGAHLLLGAYLDRKGQSQQALDEYEAALRVNPNLRDVKLQVGFLYVKLGRASEALRIARELEQVAPKSSAPLLLKGVTLLTQNNAQGAIEAFNAVLKIKPDVLEAHRGLGQAYQQLGQNDQAVESYRRALALNDKEDRIKFVPGDTRLTTDAAANVAVAHSFASNGKVLAVSGPAGSQEVQDSTAVYKGAGLAPVSGSATRIVSNIFKPLRAGSIPQPWPQTSPVNAILMSRAWPSARCGVRKEPTTGSLQFFKSRRS